MKLSKVLKEMFDQPIDSWSNSFRDWIQELTHNNYCNTHGYNLAENDEQYKVYAGEALDMYIEWLDEADLDEV